MYTAAGVSQMLKDTGILTERKNITVKSRKSGSNASLGPDFDDRIADVGPGTNSDEVVVKVKKSSDVSDIVKEYEALGLRALGSASKRTIVVYKD
jgi:hypothetical protein